MPAHRQLPDGAQLVAEFAGAEVYLLSLNPFDQRYANCRVYTLGRAYTTLGWCIYEKRFARGGFARSLEQNAPGVYKWASDALTAYFAANDPGLSAEDLADLERQAKDRKAAHRRRKVNGVN